MKHLFRFYCSTLSPHAPTVSLEGEEHQHLSKVLRLGVGEVIEVFDGLGTVVRAEIVDLNKKTSLCKILSVELVEKPSKDVCLAMGCLPPKKLAEVLPALVEVGVDTIHLFLQDGLPKKRIEEKNVERWEKLLIEAGKQSKRAWLPKIKTHSSLANLVKDLGSDHFLFVANPEATHSMLEVSKPHEKDAVIFVGSEQGLSQDEITYLNEQGAIGVRLGSYILRAGTAAVLAIGLLSLARKA